MKDKYIEIRSTADYQTFIFVSEGRHGNLVKIVSFDKVAGLSNTFNLALGTMLPDGEIDFFSITNNGDRNKILVTVAEIIRKFIEKNPDKIVYITGSDSRKTFLYQRTIAYGYDYLVETFNIYGDISVDSSISDLELFDKTKSYSGFLVERK